MSHIDDSIARLTIWIRDYGNEKQPAFIADLQAVLAEVERLNIVLGESIGKNGQAVVRQCVFCQREFTRFACESRMHCRGCE